MAEISLIKQVARGIRYSRLSELIGQAVSVSSLESAEKTVETLVNQNVPGDYVTEPVEKRFLNGAIAKYGILDQTLIALSNVPDPGYEVGIRVLKQLNLLPKSSADEIAMEMWRDVLLGMLQDIESGKTFIRVFSKTDVTDYSLRERLTFTIDGLPTNFFPRTFIIEDACISNAKDVWLSKHFYL